MTVDNIVKRLLPDENNYVYGFADMQGFLPERYSRYKSALSIGKRLPGHLLDEIKALKRPTLDYHYANRESRGKLAELTLGISKELMQAGYPNLPADEVKAEPSELEELARTHGAAFSHKTAATRAGLGWIGKTSLLVSERFGARIRLNTILLETTELPFARPVEESRCGGCLVCVKNCPAQAANGKLWNINIERDEFFNADKCYESCATKARSYLSLDVNTCAVCIASCPRRG